MPSLQHRAFFNALMTGVGLLPFTNSGYIILYIQITLHAVSYHVFILQDIGISFFLAAGHNVGGSMLDVNAGDAYDISSNQDDIYRITNSMFSSAVRLFCLFKRWLTLAVSSCRHSATMPPTCLSFWECV